MRVWRAAWTSVVFAVALAAAIPALQAGDRDKKAEPVKIIKASETRYKGTKIISPATEKKKSKGFLWFRKKEPRKLEFKQLEPSIKKPIDSQRIEETVNPRDSESEALKKKSIPQAIDQPLGDDKSLLDASLLFERKETLPTPKASPQGKLDSASESKPEATPESEVELEGP